MKKNNIQTTVLSIVGTFYTIPTYGNVVWPAILVSNIILREHVYIIGAASIAIEAILYY